MKNYFPDSSGWAEWQRSRPEYDIRVKEFATRLHDQFCSLNHIDKCYWGYEDDDWSKYAHRKYYIRAYQLMGSGLPLDAIVEIIELGRKL